MSPDILTREQFAAAMGMTLSLVQKRTRWPKPVMPGAFHEGKRVCRIHLPTYLNSKLKGKG